MPKAEKGTPKDIAKRIKAKGLQKLKFYCQMCEKQCRDANGFKCHLTSEGHLRQMKIFSDHAGGILDQYSRDFERSYMSTLRMRHGTKRVNANNVYQEVIQDKQHIHMNATHWTTLSDFVQYLGKTGKCVVEETERGWYIQYIERDPTLLARQEAMQRRIEAEQAAEQAQAQRMEVQRIEAAKALDRAGGVVHMEATNLERKDDDPGATNPIKLALQTTKMASKPKSTTNKGSKPSVFGEEEEDDDDDDDEANDDVPNPSKFLEPLPPQPPLPSTSSRASQKSERRKHQDNREVGYRDDTQSSKRSHKDENEIPSSKRIKQSKEDDRKDYWLHKNILVRVISKTLAAGKYFKRKAIVDKVVDKFTAEVEVLDSSPDVKDGGDVLRLDQDDLETVIPKAGKRVRILNGKERGEKAILVAVDKERCKGTLRLEADGTILENVPYEDFSKLA